MSVRVLGKVYVCLEIAFLTPVSCQRSHVELMLPGTLRNQDPGGANDVKLVNLDIVEANIQLAGIS